MSKELTYRSLNKYRHSGNDRVVSISIGKIYHVREGRNAWHATWVVSYQKNSFFSSYKAAKECAENLRKSGSVFIILEIPCLVLRGENKIVFIIEANEKEPLSTHIFANKISQLNLSILEDYSERLNFLPDLVKGFMPSSFAWENKKRMDSVLILEHNNNTLKVSKAGNLLFHYVSRAVGSNYLLHWDKFKRETSFDSVSTIAENLSLVMEKDYLHGNESVIEIPLSQEAKIRSLRQKLLAEAESVHKVENIVPFVDMFLEEINAVLTEKAIANACQEDVVATMLAWFDSLHYFSRSDREKILNAECIKRGKDFYLQYSYCIKKIKLIDN